MKSRFKDFNNVEFINGLIPGSLEAFPKMEKVKYLSTDMNNGDAELQALNFFWPKIVEGGIVYCDDFGWGYQKFVDNVNKFIMEKCPSSELLHFASGQSILIKSIDRLMDV